MRQCCTRNLRYRVIQKESSIFWEMIFFFYWSPLATVPGSTAAMKAYFTSPGLEVPAFTARNTHAYDARDL
jgi:hypothetical protein